MEWQARYGQECYGAQRMVWQAWNGGSGPDADSRGRNGRRGSARAAGYCKVWLGRSGEVWCGKDALGRLGGVRKGAVRRGVERFE